jgi:ribonucleoside-diphosphate reductase alpha chain
MEHYAWTLGLTRMISAVFRRGGDVTFVAEELKAVFDPRGGAWVDGRYVPSLLAAIGGVIERHLGAGGALSSTALACEPVDPVRPASGASCPRCGTPGLLKKEGCETCLDCGYSKCG